MCGSVFMFCSWFLDCYCVYSTDNLQKIIFWGGQRKMIVIIWLLLCLGKECPDLGEGLLNYLQEKCREKSSSLQMLDMEHRVINVNSVSLYLKRFLSDIPSPQVLQEEMTWMKERLSNLGSPVVLCHNDLLCKNIIYNKKRGRCWTKQWVVSGLICAVIACAASVVLFYSLVEVNSVWAFKI